jgi:hypothetical protein
MSNGARFIWSLVVILTVFCIFGIVATIDAPPSTLVSGQPFVDAQEHVSGSTNFRVKALGSLDKRVRVANDDLLEMTWESGDKGVMLGRVAFQVRFIGADKSVMYGRLVDTMIGVDMGRSRPWQGVPAANNRQTLLFQFDPEWQLQLGSSARMKFRLDTTALPQQPGGTRLEVYTGSGKLLARLIYD